MNREILFRDIEGFDRYEISSDGSVYSRNYKNRKIRVKLKTFPDKDGYRRIFLFNENGRQIKIVHRLMAQAFIDNPENKEHVNHKNGIRDDNRLENLEWATPRENCIHGWQVNGRQHSEKSKQLCRNRFSGAKNPKAKITMEIAVKIRKLRRIGSPLIDIATAFDISMGQVSSICSNRFWKEPENESPNLINKQQ